MKQQWGLMGRKKLPENHGMLFVYDSPQHLNFWMFNTFINLSIAYIDEYKVIREIHHLKAYPERMDPQRPVTRLTDMAKYPYNDPVRQFYWTRRVSSNGVCKYALEVNAGWFEKNDVRVGDKIIWPTTERTQLRFEKENVRHTSSKRINSKEGRKWLPH